MFGFINKAIQSSTNIATSIANLELPEKEDIADLTESTLDVTGNSFISKTVSDLIRK